MIVVEEEAQNTQNPSTEYYKRCGDCGQFVPKKMWKKRGTKYYDRALCEDCLRELLERTA